jgi:phosphohistidine swiveling domain-containing protein
VTQLKTIASVFRDPDLSKDGQIAFGTKFETLQALQGRLSSARILPMHGVTVGAYQAAPEKVIDEILQDLSTPTDLIVRSSAQGEDGADASMAGKYESVGNVRGPRALRTAIDVVIDSYDTPNPADQVLVQPMLQDVAASGVVFSMDPSNGAPYRIINFTEDGDTSAITSGASSNEKTYFVSRHAATASDPLVARLVDLVDELESVTSSENIDLEFAVTSDDELYLLQARPLVIKAAAQPDSIAHAADLSRIEEDLKRRLGAHPFLLGDKTIYGVMPDWNPAEIIGVRPKPLALSLYRDLVTDSVWAYQRHNYGYKNLRSFPLLCDFCGIPFIDVRVSFNSFIPSDIEDGLAEKLANYYLDELISRPTLHDKVEFEIIFSCYTLDLDARMETLSAHGFSGSEIETLKESLRNLTNRIICKDGLWRKDLAKLDVLQERHRVIMSEPVDPISRIYWLLEDCKRYGTLPFAGLARAGFIAVQLLRSLVNSGALSEAGYQSFMASLSTVSGEMARDFAGLPRASFLSKYGHLRPGTYEIGSARYDEMPDEYFDWDNHSSDALNEEGGDFALTLDQMNRVESLLAEHRLDHDVVGLFNFLKAGIEGREKAKFHFTRNLSDALKTICAVGVENGFSKEDLSFLNIGVFRNLYSRSEDTREALDRSIALGREEHAKTQSISLPSVITDPKDVWCFEVGATEANYVTQISAVGPVVDVKHGDLDALDGAIAMIPNADPGFDWLFSHNIAGLITAYGGVNSHMAIRAGELRIPAVIGAGEALYGKWSKAARLFLDCANKKVEIIK